MTDTLDLTGLRAADADVRHHVAAGRWRRETVVDDLYRWAAETPDAVALVARRGDEVTRTTYREYAGQVDRYAAALRGLGVGPGDTVSLWLPTLRQVPPLMVAVWSLGAVLAPSMTTIGPRELERMLARVAPRVCITVEEHDGVRHADVLAEVGRRIPALRHQVVLGRPGPGQLGFEATFEATFDAGFEAPVPPGTGRPAGAVDPDRVSLVLFTSGTTGEPKAALHSLNTVDSFCQDLGRAFDIDATDCWFTPHAVMHGAGMAGDVLVPLQTGSTAALLDRWDPAVAAELVVAERVTFWASAPVFLEQLLDHLPGPGRTALRYVCSYATTTPEALVTRVPERLGLPLHSVWAMTEAYGTFTGPDSTPDAARTIGRPARSLETALLDEDGAPVAAGVPGRFVVRGAGVCLATVGRDSGRADVLATHDGGWYDTGDLAVALPDGSYRLLGRAADRIGGAFMIPVADVEDALRGHPAVHEAALVGVADGHGGEVACAVVESTGAPSLEELRGYLLDQGMTEWYLPQRLEIVDTLPRTATGKVAKQQLRDHLAGRPDPAAAAHG